MVVSITIHDNRCIGTKENVTVDVDTTNDTVEKIKNKIRANLVTRPDDFDDSEKYHITIIDRNRADRAVEDQVITDNDIEKADAHTRWGFLITPRFRPPSNIDGGSRSSSKSRSRSRSKSSSRSRSRSISKSGKRSGGRSRYRRRRTRKSHKR